MERQVLSVPEAGEYLGLGKVAAYRAAKRGDMPVIRINGRLRVPKPALARLLNGQPATEPSALEEALAP